MNGTMPCQKRTGFIALLMEQWVTGTEMNGSMRLSLWAKAMIPGQFTH
jgi:hypothetical protein